jgi:hypothetical protein
MKHDKPGKPPGYGENIKESLRNFDISATVHEVSHEMRHNQ